MQQKNFTPEKKLTMTQELLVKMLDWYHKFCIEHKLRYYVVGGTLIGAVRHHVFIPWDDDIDVAMPRKDYERFIELASCLSEDHQYVVETAYNDNDDFLYPFAKLYDTSTTLVENVRYPIKRGIYIDIFPVDGIGKNKKESYKNYKSIWRKMMLLNIAKCKITSKRLWYKNLAILGVRLLLPTAKCCKVLLNNISTQCKKYDFDSSAIVGVLVGVYGYRELMRKEVFGTPCMYKFESITVCGVEQPDCYLTALYGDYMCLPPEEKRQSHHNYLYCDLQKSYLSGIGCK